MRKTLLSLLLLFFLLKSFTIFAAFDKVNFYMEENLQDFTCQVHLQVTQDEIEFDKRELVESRSVFQREEPCGYEADSEYEANSEAEVGAEAQGVSESGAGAEANGEAGAEAEGGSEQASQTRWRLTYYQGSENIFPPLKALCEAKSKEEIFAALEKLRFYPLSSDHIQFYNRKIIKVRLFHYHHYRMHQMDSTLKEMPKVSPTSYRDLYKRVRKSVLKERKLLGKEERKENKLKERILRREEKKRLHEKREQESAGVFRVESAEEGLFRKLYSGEFKGTSFGLMNSFP